MLSSVRSGRLSCQYLDNRILNSYSEPQSNVSTTILLVSGPVIELSHLSKSYPIYSSASDRLKELATLNRRSFHTDYWALRDISFTVEPGETFCIVGENGSGKSTLLQICAGILQPTEGSLDVRGRVSALLELGAGFNPEFTGRDNVYLNGAILGFSRKEMDHRFPHIEAFAEIGDFIDRAVKTYSSGMIVRLAFAVAIHVDPEILLVDEALAVGDVYFRQRCMRKVHEMRAQGTTILFVSHSTGDIKALGSRALWLDHGRMMAMGRPDLIVSKYLAAMAAKDTEYRSHELPVASQNPNIVPPELLESHPQHRSSLRRRARGDLRDRRLQRGRRGAHLAPTLLHHGGPHQRPGQSQSGPSHCRVHVPQSSGRRFRWHKHNTRRICSASLARRVNLYRGFLCRPARRLRFALFIFAGRSRRLAGAVRDLRLDRQRSRSADGTRRCAGLRPTSLSLPRTREYQARNGGGRLRSGNPVNEFTGERVIPGQVNEDLWAEHIARYAFASRFAAHSRVLDAGCGAGYGAAAWLVRPHR